MRYATSTRRSLRGAWSLGDSTMQSININMPSEASTSCQGFEVKHNARVHAGPRIYNYVTNIHPNQNNKPTISTAPSASLPTPPQLAPTEDPVHKKLLSAAREGQGKNRLETLLSRGADFESRDRFGLTALYYAAFRGDQENVEYLAARGADVNMEHDIFGTPIAIAALRRHATVVKTLLQRGADHSRSLAHLGSALHCACFGGDLDIFKSIPHEVRFTTRRNVRLKVYSVLSDTDLKPTGFGRLLRNGHYCEGLQISCSPVFLAAERCHFDILQLCWDEHSHHYFTHSHWDLAEEEKVEIKAKPQSRIKTSLASWESRSGVSNVSRASTSSTWSLLGFTSAARETIRPTLLMWAAASLNLRLIRHLLQVGASAGAADEGGKTALHYAAAPFEDAAFDNVTGCVQLLLANQASSAVPTIRIIQKQSLAGPIKSPLDLVVSAEHAALDPRTPSNWGLDIHQTFISSFLDPLPTEDQKAKLARGALPHALSHDTCPADSIKLLCKHAVKSCRDLDSLSISQCMNESLRNALQSCAAEPVISILLDHGADPNASLPYHQLMTAIDRKATTAVVAKLLDYGADSCIVCGVPGGPRMTPYEYAKSKNRWDLIRLFQMERPTKLTPTHPAPLMATEQPDRAPWDARPQHMPTATKALKDVLELDEADEVDELNDITGDPGYELEVCPTHASQDAGGSGRPWFSGITARFRRNSKPK